MSKKISNKLRDSLFRIGHILPETSEEIKEFDKIIKKRDLPKLPESFGSPSEIIKKGKPNISKLITSSSIEQNEINNNMARAAREGKKNISPEILKKMKKDRNAAQNNDESEE